MIFDGTCHKLDHGCKVASEAQTIANFLKARNKSIVDKMLDLRAHYESIGEYPSISLLAKEIGKSLGLSDQTIRNAALKSGKYDSLKPTTIDVETPLYSVPDDCKRFLTRAWS